MAEEIDGVKLIREKLNAELVRLSKDLSNTSLDYQFTLDRISEVSKTLKKLPKEDVPKEKKSGKFAKESDERSYSERKADDSRQEK